MKDMLNKEIRLNDQVAYVTMNKQGRTVAIGGKVIGFNNKGAKVITSRGVINVRNLIKLEEKRGIFANIFNRG